MPKQPQLHIDLSEIIRRAHRKFSQHIEGASVTLSLPFLSFTATPVDLERRVAREILIRMSDRRVLSFRECCDTCIDQALESLQSIRSMLVDKQVELENLTDGPLYFLLEAMLEGVRQFLSFEQRLSELSNDREPERLEDFGRPHDQREAYFAALEALRGHMSRCLSEISVIADVELPKIGMIAIYRDEWPLELYSDPTPMAPIF